MTGDAQALAALAEPLPGGGFRIASPRVGIYRGRPRIGSHRGAGDIVGRLIVLGRSIDIVLPDGTGGLVTEVSIHDLAVPVEYGHRLFDLSPIAAPATAGVARKGPSPRSGGAGASLPPGAHAVTSPIDGVFYRRPAPGAPAFVEAGSTIEEGRTLGLVEAMKSFNAVVYGGAGLPERAEILDVRAEDGTEVRQGAILFVVKASGGDPTGRDGP